MAEYPDLSYYRYTDAQWAFVERFPYVLLNVGWLGRRRGFQKGRMPDKDRVLYGVMRHCKYPVNLMCGFHICELCKFPAHRMLEVTWHRQSFHVGNGEIFVRGVNNLVYVAPTMIYHYMEAHNYLPPPEFIEAVRDEPFDHFHHLYERARRIPWDDGER